MFVRHLNDSGLYGIRASKSRSLLLGLLVAASLLVILSRSSLAQSDEKAAQPQKGGLVQQLRSLSENAMDALKPEPTTTSSSTPRNTYNPKMARPKGRSASQHTSSAPSQVRSQTAATTVGRQNRNVRPDRLPAVAKEPNVSRGPTVSRGPVSHGLAASQGEESQGDDKLPEIVKAQSYDSKSRQANVKVAAQAKASTAVARARPASPALEINPEVHVEESLPAIVRQSIRGNFESTAGEPTSNSNAAVSREDEFQIFPRRSSETSGDAAQNVTAVPQVSRIPLPSLHKKGQPQNGQFEPALSNQSSSIAQTSESLTTDLPSAGDVSDSSSTAPSTGSLSSLPSLRSLSDLPSAAEVNQTQPAPMSNAGSVSDSMVATPAESNSPENNSMDASGGVRVPTSLISSPKSERQGQVQAYGLRQDTTPTLPELALPEPTALAPQFDYRSNTAQQNTAQPNNPAAITTLPSLPALDPPALAVPQQLQSNESGDGEQRIHMETPRIQVMLNGPSDLPVGTPAQYEIVIQNSDSIDLSGIILRLDIPAGVNAHSLKPTLGEMQVEKADDGATLFTWSFEGLAAGKTASVPIELVATSARNFGVAMEWTITPIAGSSAVEVRAPQLELVLEGPAEVNFGEANTYRLHVRNPGSADATQVAVKLSAEPYGASSSNIGTVPAGAEETIDVELTFNEAGTIRIAANATAANDLSSLTKIDVLVRRPNLTTTIEGPELIYHGASVDYLVTVCNTGDAEARNVTATVTIPDGAKLVHLPNAATLRDSKMTWPISSIKAGETLELPLQLNLTQAGENAVSIVCSTPTGLKTDCTAITTVEAFADLHLLMEDPVAPAAVGREVTYGLTLTNRGSKVANNVRVIAQFSEGVEPVRGEGCQARIAPGQLFFEPIKRLEPGQTIALKVIALADQAGMHRFRAEVRSEGTEQKLVQEESTQYLNRSGGRIASPPTQSVIR